MPNFIFFCVIELLHPKKAIRSEKFPSNLLPIELEDGLEYVWEGKEVPGSFLVHPEQTLDLLPLEELDVELPDAVLEPTRLRKLLQRCHFMKLMNRVDRCLRIEPAI